MITLRLAAFNGDLPLVKKLTKENRKAVHLAGPETLRTALHRACENGHNHVVTYLLKSKSAKADPNVMDYQGNTPLHLAIQAFNVPLTKKIAIIEVLLSAKADVTIANHKGETAQQYLISMRDNRPLGSHLREGLNNIVRKMNELTQKNSLVTIEHEPVRAFSRATRT